ncbi:sensor histidine kinase YesM [Pedobacter sp. AK013]|uniref:sensor histidine kinase n=1 Tax=Pedobacter sp. AK013 TaxID=2723071 RepID=UPI00160F18EC|nr:histidine kinase [Pedobacter sp. AK013]MBB6239052.1 sensor histidine kinase YesM [Pedobacter sp. AK013]
MLNKNFNYKYQDFFIFVGLLLWIAIFNTHNLSSKIWLGYASCILALVFCLLPVLVFSFLKTRLKNVLSKNQYITHWCTCFFILLPLFTDIASYLQIAKLDHAVFISTALAAVALEMMLIANQYYQKKVQHIKWIKKIGLENAVLITIILLAATISVMAVSSLENPIYQRNGFRLIGFEFNIKMLLFNFGTFLGFFSQFLIMYLCGYLLFLINSRFLVSKILKEKGLLIYLLTLSATIAVLYPLLAQLLISLPINTVFGRRIFVTNPFELENAFGAFAIMLVSLPVVLALQWGKQNNKILLLEKEKSQNELDLLKQQLNPHFFFNTLNNLYALSLQKSDKTPESILQLSELMRYTIYRGQEKTVKLSQELDYIHDYIQLQQIRLQKTLDFEFNKQVVDDQIDIAPLLLIVFVENAFKHGIERAEEEAILKLSLISNHKAIVFCCENSFDPEESTGYKGIGIDNLKKRLDLLYPNRYTLHITSDGNIFKAELKLQLT